MGNVAVYKKGTTDFFSQGLGLLSDVVSSNLTQTVSSTGNVEQKLEVEYPIDGYLVSELVEGAILRVSVSTDKSDYGVFEIVDTLKDDSGTITVYGDPYYNRILRMSFDNGGVFTKFPSVQSALNSAKQNITGFPADFNLISNLSTSVDLSANTYDTFGTFLEALNSAVHGNIKYSLNSIQIYSALGKDITDITLRDDMNTSSIKITTDFSGIINKVIPVLPVLDKDGNATDQTKVGTIVTSKYSNQFLDYWAGKVIQFDTQDLANTYFDRTNADRPVQTVDVDPIGLDDDFSTINIFDTIELYSTRLDYTDKLRVSERVFDTLAENVTSFKLGSSSVNIFNQINEQNNEIFNNVVKLTNAAISANGKGIDYFGQAQPSSPKDGDTWFWDDGTDFGIKQYTNGEWVDLAGSKTAEKIAAGVTDAVTQAKEHTATAIEQNNASQQEVMNDIAKSQAYLAIKDGDFNNKAQAMADKALADAKADIDGKISQQQVTIDGITDTVSNPTTGLSTRVQTAEGTLSTVKSTADGAMSKASQTANDISQEISDRKTGDSNTLQSSKDFTVSSISYSETGMKSLISQKADSVIVGTMSKSIDDLKSVTNWQQISYNNIDYLQQTGNYLITQSDNTNFPPGVTAWVYIKVEAPRSDRVTQTVWKDLNATQSYVRIFDGTNWSVWSQQVTSSTLLGIFKDSWSLGTSVNNDIGAQITSGIVANSDSMSLISKNIVLDGDTTVTGAFKVSQANIANGAIGTAQIGDAAITNAKIADLDVSKITGNVTNFIQSYWNGVYGSTTMNANGLSVQSGSMTTLFDSSGAHFAQGNRTAQYSFGNWIDNTGASTSAVGLYMGLRGDGNSFIDIVGPSGAAVAVIAGWDMADGANTNNVRGAINLFADTNIRSKLLFKGNDTVTSTYIEADEIRRTMNFYTDNAKNGDGNWFWFNHKVLSTGTFSSTSLLSKKNVIADYEEDALSEISKTDIVEFEYKNDVGEKHISPIIDDVNDEKDYYIPKTILGQDEEYVDMYSMISMAWKAIKQLNEKIGEK